MPFMGKPDAEPLSGDELKMLEEMADIDGPMVDYSDKGHSVELVGTEEVEGTEAYKLKVTRKNGDVQFSFLDTEHFLEFRQEAKRKIQGNELEIVSTFGDYKEVGGVLMAFSTEQQLGASGTMNVAIDSVDLEVEVEDDFFTMPVAKKAPTGE